MGEVVRWLLGGHSGFGVQEYLVCLLFASLGAFTCAFAVNPKITLPTKTRTAVDLGFLRFILIGTAAGLAVGYPPPIPFLVGLVSPVVLPILLYRLLPAVLRALQPVLTAVFSSVIQEMAGKKEQK